MGIYDYISSTVDSIKPNLIAVKGLCWDSYDHSRAAVKNISNAAAVNGKAVVEKVNQNLPDEETRSEIITNLVKNSAHFAVNEGLKLFPGGSAVANIVSRSLPGDKKKSKNDKELQELKDRLERMEEKLNDYKMVLEKNAMQKPTAESKSENIRAFRMTEFVGNHFLDV